MKNYFKIVSLSAIFFIISCTKTYTINDDIASYKITKGNDRKYAEETLQEVLTTNKDHNVIQPNTIIIKSPETAIKALEPILFDIYGEKNIMEQRPYEVSDFKDYYVINGTLDVNSIGGTFLIIINKKNGEIIKITHGK
jgi:hypothetical protein